MLTDFFKYLLRRSLITGIYPHQFVLVSITVYKKQQQRSDINSLGKNERAAKYFVDIVAIAFASPLPDRPFVVANKECDVPEVENRRDDKEHLSMDRTIDVASSLVPSLMNFGPREELLSYLVHLHHCVVIETRGRRRWNNETFAQPSKSTKARIHNERYIYIYLYASEC